MRRSGRRPMAGPGSVRGTTPSRPRPPPSTARTPPIDGAPDVPRGPQPESTSAHDGVNTQLQRLGAPDRQHLDPYRGEGQPSTRSRRPNPIDSRAAGGYCRPATAANALEG